MSFIAIDLSVLAYANNFTQWHYTTEDVAIDTAGYFNDASDMLGVNDWLQVQSSVTNLGTIAENSIYVVTGNDGDNVEVTRMVGLQGKAT